MASQLALTIPMPQPGRALQRVVLPDPDDQRQAEERLQIIQVLLDFRSDPSRFAQLRLQDGTPVTSFSRMVAYTADLTGKSEPSLYRWVARYRGGDVTALADRTRSDKNTSRFFAAYPKAGWLAAYLYFICKQSFRVAYEAIIRNPKMVEVPEDNLPSYETVRAWLRSAPPYLKIYALKGQKAYREQMSPYLKRGYIDVFSNEVWIEDCMIHDVIGWNDIFEDAEWGEQIRIRLDAFSDYRSRLFVGATWCWEGSHRSITAAFAPGVRKYGAPQHVLLDNGKPQDKAAKGARRGYMCADPDWRSAELKQIATSGIFARFGTAVTQCLPYHGQAKPIERQWRTIHERFDRAWHTYTTGSPFTRSDATTAAMMRHKKLHKRGQLISSDLPPVSQIIAACRAWMEEYADTPHRGEGMDGATPRQVYAENLDPQRKPIPDQSTLAVLLLERERRQVRECSITHNKARYVPCDPAGWQTLHNYNAPGTKNQREVLIAYNSGDRENAAALDLDGYFLCALKAEELVRFAPYDAKTQAQIAESMSQRRHLEKTTRETLSIITRTARQIGARSPLEAMAERLQLPADTDLSNIVTQRNPKLGQSTDDTNPAPATPAQAARLFLERQKNEQAR